MSLAVAIAENKCIESLWPESESVDDAIPERANQLLRQAIDSINAPAGAVVLAAASVDSMLKVKGYTNGNLNSRINEAKASGLITGELAAWAHEIRLDANAQRHADDTGPLPNAADARKVIEFAQALGQFLFVLPAMVTHGRSIAGGATTATTTT